MPFYLFKARYTAGAIKAMVENPQDREAAARPLIEAPDDKAMAAGAMAVGASGAFSAGSTTKLMTSKEAMAAMKAAKTASAAYRPIAA